MKGISLFIVIFCFICVSYGSELLTVAEQTNYAKTSLYADVVNFINEVVKNSDMMHIKTLGYSAEGKMIPLVIVSKDGIKSPYELKIHDKEAVLIMANIHAGEVEGIETSQMFIRDIASEKLKHLINNQIILFIPIFNVDGNDKLGHNRRDNGPELAGVRHNGQNLDLNRDYIKLETPEVKALVKLMIEWDPILIVDMHTTDGSYHQEPINYATVANPNTDSNIIKYMWEKLLPEVTKELKDKYGYDSIPYGNFIDRLEPEKGWINDSLDARFGTNYVGLRNRFSILDENYSYADFKTRVLSSYYFIKSILEFTDKNIKEMAQIVKQADRNTMNSFYLSKFALEYKAEKLFDITVKSYEFLKEKIKPEDKSKYPSWIGDYIVKPSDKTKDYKIPYYSKAVASREVELEEGYIIMPHQTEIIENLKNHGIILEKILNSFKVEAENFVIEEINLGKNLYQGRIPLDVKGSYRDVEVEIPEGAYYVSMKQPLARLIAVLLEPNHIDSLLSWGFFNRVLVQQWTNLILPYPVYRLNGRLGVPTVIER